jgi:hypothetical protein
MDVKDNNSIEELSHILHEHINNETHNMTELLNEVKAMREEVKPLVDIYKDSLGTYKILTGFFKLAAVVAAGIAALLFIKKL